MKQTVGELVYKITGDIGDLEASVKKSEAEIKRLGEKIEDTQKSTAKAEKGFRGMATALKGAFAFFVSGKVLGFIQSSIQAASDRLEQETRLAQVLRVSTNATDEQIRALKEQAAELEKVGVLDKQIITTVQAQLATFDLRADSIKGLTPAILNYVAAEKGVNATQQEAQQLTNGLAQALQGKFASLTQVGFVLDENTKKMIANGTETERITALSEVLDSTYKDVNKTLAGTFLGTMSRVKRSFGDMQEDLGFALMPALGLLGEEVLGISADISKGSERVNAWGKTFFQLANIVKVVIKGFKVFGLGVKSGLILAESGIASFLEKITDLRITVAKLRGQDVAELEGQKSAYQEIYSQLATELTQNGEDIIKTHEEMGDAMSQAIDPTEFKGVTDAAISEYKRLETAEEEAAGAAKELAEAQKKAKQELESFQGQMVGFVDDSKKVVEALEKELGEAFTKFGESISENVKETGDSLADIVIGAESKLKELKQSLKGEDDSDARNKLKKEIKEQEEILKSRKDFEERQASELLSIREKLAKAGIDVSGIKALEEVSTLEEQIAEKRRVAALDEFARFEEQSFLKLQKLADDFIAENTLLTGKIEKQKELEAELTTFLLSQNSARTESIDEFANNAIAKYGEMAASLRSAISLQSRLNALRSNPEQFHEGGAVGASGGEVHAGEYVIPANLISKFGGAISAIESARTGGGVINNKTVNAPINIQTQVSDGLDFRTLSREMAWELGKR